MIEDLIREITALWQTDELRRRKPTPVDEARGGLHIVEQSLWNALPTFCRQLSAALKKHTGHALPLDCVPVRFGSWMGGDRDGNPNVTAKVTQQVAYLARWIAADLYLKEVDALAFELSMASCNDELFRHTLGLLRRQQGARPEGATSVSSGGRSHPIQQNLEIPPTPQAHPGLKLQHDRHGSGGLPEGLITGTKIADSLAEGLDASVSIMPNIGSEEPGYAFSESGGDIHLPEDLASPASRSGWASPVPSVRVPSPQADPGTGGQRHVVESAMTHLQLSGTSPAGQGAGMGRIPSDSSVGPGDASDRSLHGAQEAVAAAAAQAHSAPSGPTHHRKVSKVRQAGGGEQGRATETWQSDSSSLPFPRSCPPRWRAC